MDECKECYSLNNRITPLIEPENCLENHMQYICGSCGRCICISKDEKRNLQRWNFPFKSLEIAKLYLRTADITQKKCCGIYEIISSNSRKSYKIFDSDEEFKAYLLKNKDKTSCQKTFIYKRDEYKEFSNTQIKTLKTSEIDKYLSERNNKH